MFVTLLISLIPMLTVTGSTFIKDSQLKKTKFTLLSLELKPTKLLLSHILPIKLHHLNSDSTSEPLMDSMPPMVISITSNSDMMMETLLEEKPILDKLLKAFHYHNSSITQVTLTCLLVTLTLIPDGDQSTSKNGMENMMEYSNGPLTVGLELKEPCNHGMNSSD